MTESDSVTETPTLPPMYRLSPAMSWLLGLASFVVIIAGMKAARELIVPFLASLFLTVICYPALEWLQKKGMSTLFSLFVLLTLDFFLCREDFHAASSISCFELACFAARIAVVILSPFLVS